MELKHLFPFNNITRLIAHFLPCIFTGDAIFPHIFCYHLLCETIVFHQADGAGNPVMDLGHVVTALNKLDAADEEKIVLSSRDGKSLMVVSYADVARCLDSAYHELCVGSVPPSSVHSPVPPQPY